LKIQFGQFIGLVCLALLSTEARAGASFACAALDSIKEVTAFECDDNHFYGQAGLDCLHSLESAIQSRAALAAKQMAASNAEHVDQAGNAQTHNFQGSNGDYSLSDEALAELIANAKAARENVDQYLNNVYYPEDWDAPEELIGDTNDFLDDNECYADNRDGLRQVKKKIEGYIDQLQAAKTASLERAKISSERNVGQDSLNVQIVKGGTSGEGSGVKDVPKGHSPTPASTITGVHEDAEKRAKAVP